MSLIEQPIPSKIRMMRWFKFVKEQFYKHNLPVTGLLLGEKNRSVLSLKEDLIYEHGYLKITIFPKEESKDWELMGIYQEKKFTWVMIHEDDTFDSLM